MFFGAESIYEGQPLPDRLGNYSSVTGREMIGVVARAGMNWGEASRLGQAPETRSSGEGQGLSRSDPPDRGNSWGWPGGRSQDVSGRTLPGPRKLGSARPNSRQQGKSSEFPAFRPILGETVPESPTIRGGFGKIPYAAEQGI